MKRLILTTDEGGAARLRQAGLADIVIAFGFRFVWGPLPSDADIAKLLDTQSSLQADLHLDIDASHLAEADKDELRLVDLCHRCDTIELWIDPGANAQLAMVWLLNCLRAHGPIVAKLQLVQADIGIRDHVPDELTAWKQRAVTIGSDHLETAGAVWRAYRAPTPHPWFNLLARDWRGLPQLGHAVLDLLEELPARSTGLGATQMRMLEIVSAGQASPVDLLAGHAHNPRRVFDYWEAGSLLDGLARCPEPVITGLADEPFTTEMHDDVGRHRRYFQSKLSLTTLGADILARADDFSRHNPIQRGWGGTELTNDRLWRWFTVNRALIVP